MHTALWSKATCMFILHTDNLCPVHYDTVPHMLTNIALLNCSSQYLPLSLVVLLFCFSLITNNVHDFCLYLLPFLSFLLSGCFVCECMRESIHAHATVCIWGSKDNLGCHSSPTFSIFLFFDFLDRVSP